MGIYVNNQNMTKSISRIIKETFAELNEKWNVYMCASALQLIFSLSLILFLPPFGILLCLFVFAITNVKLALHSTKRIKNQDTNFAEIFNVKNFFPILTTKIVRAIQVCFWSIFLIVPGIMVALDYCLVDHIMSKNPKMESFEVLSKSANLMQDHKIKMLVLWLIYMLLTAIIILFACSIIIITKFFLYLSPTFVITFLILVIVILTIFVVQPFIKVSKTIFYLDLIKESENENSK